MIVSFKHLRAGKDKVSASQYNRLVDVVEMMANSMIADGIMAGGQILKRRTPIAGTEVKLAKAQEDAQADEYISVKLLDSDEAETGDAFDVKCSIALGGTALNATLTRIETDDYLFIKQIGGTWWCVGMPFMPSEDCVCTIP